jgi:hypothetical protein
LRAVFSHSELAGLVDTMAERGLRLRHELEEFLGVSAEPGGSDAVALDGYGEEEIEYNAAELRRLRPY